MHRCVGRDHRESVARIAEILLSLDADVIALQEVDCCSPEHGVDQLAFLADALGMHALFGFTLCNQRGAYGNGLLTRLAIRRHHEIPLSDSRREPRCAIDVELDFHSQSLRVIATHLGLGLFERRRQVHKLAHLVARAPEQPLILLGDLNEWLPGGGALRSLRSLFEISPRPATFPAARPMLALDRILVRPSIAQEPARVVRSSATAVASDHLPVMMSISREALCAEGAMSESRRDVGALRHRQ